VEEARTAESTTYNVFVEDSLPPYARLYVARFETLEAAEKCASDSSSRFEDDDLGAAIEALREHGFDV
jgi:hypothetical protein